MAIFAIVLYAGCDVKICLQHASHDKMDQAFCTKIRTASNKCARPVESLGKRQTGLNMFVVCVKLYSPSHPPVQSQLFILCYDCGVV